MRHFIIVKFKPEVTQNQKEKMIPEIKMLFDNTKQIKGINNVTVHKNCISRDNRYDIMIEMEMDASSLAEYDSCIWHKRWKEEYGNLIDKKAIFDCDD